MNVRLWLHFSDMPPWSLDERCWVNSGSHLLALSFSGFDPTATLAVHCGNGFDAGFRLYQCTRLNRYDAVS
jgi:hypothetical protein